MKHKRLFISQLQVPGVISIKPTVSDVILAINNFVNYYRWHKFAFTKYQLGKLSCVRMYLLVNVLKNINPNVLMMNFYRKLQLQQVRIRVYRSDVCQVLTCAFFVVDKSPFCDDLATQLQVDASGHLNNYSVLILAKYEDVFLPHYSPMMERVQGKLLCHEKSIIYSALNHVGAILHLRVCLCTFITLGTYLRLLTIFLPSSLNNAPRQRK